MSGTFIGVSYLGQFVLPAWTANLAAALVVGFGAAYGRARVQQRFAPTPPELEAPQDFRDIVGSFAASTRESLDVPSICTAFMTAVDESLGPTYQAIMVKSAKGVFEPIAAVRLASRVPGPGPREDETVIPLRVGENVICRLVLGPKTDGREYESADFALLDGLGQSLALSVHNAQLFKELAGQERLKRELEIAYEVQTGLLPKAIPEPTAALLAAECVPAFEVGGDFYDFVQIDATRWGMLIGDVAGKGVPAALMMAVSLTLFRALAPGVPSPASTLGRLNKLVHRNRPSNKIFVAAIYMIYDARDGSVLIANAGHPKPLLDGVPVEIKGLPLGCASRTVYREVRVELAPGATLVTYSDGLEDVETEAGEQYGCERVEQFFRENINRPPQVVLEQLRQVLGKFAGGAQAADDQTVILLQRSIDAVSNPPRAATRVLERPAPTATAPLRGSE